MLRRANSNFQFQYGTIKSVKPLHSMKYRSTFNSSMVRLKVVSGNYSPGITPNFQFQYGTIKSIFSVNLIFIKASFNSSMVRLKV